MRTSYLSFSRQSIRCGLGFALSLAVMRAVDAHAEVALADSVTVSVLADPDGASIFVDGKAHGYSPQTLRGLPANHPFTIRLEAQGHQPLERTFNLPAGKVVPWQAELLPLFPGVEVTTTPGADVVATTEHGDRVRLGVADEKGVLSSAGLVAGSSCTLLISKDGYETLEQKVSLDAKIQQKVTLLLRPKAARIQVVSIPTVGEVYVDGVKTQLTRGVVEVKPDTKLTVEIRKDGYKAKTEEVSLAKGEERSVNFGNLDAVNGELRIVVATADGPVGSDFNDSVRLFVDGVDKKWNRGVISDLSLGRHEIAIFSDLYATSTPQEAEIKENQVSTLTITATLKTAHVQLVFADQNAPSQYQVLLNGVEVVGEAGNYEVPVNKSFNLAIRTTTFKDVSRDFEAVNPGSSSTWNLKLETDPDKIARINEEKKRIAFAAAETSLNAQLDNYKEILLRSIMRAQLTVEKFEAGKKYLENFRANNREIAENSTSVKARMNEIDALLNSHQPATKAPNPFS